MNNSEKQKKHIKRTSNTEASKNTKTDFKHLVSLFEQAHYAMQTQAARSVDIALVVRNWLFGWYIIEYQQHGSDRAEYGTGLLKTLSKVLSRKLGRGFSVDNLELMRKFYLEYKDKQPESFNKSLALEKSETVSRIFGPISETTSRNLNLLPATISKLGKIWLVLSEKFSLSWSHYIVLMTIRSIDERRFYEIEALASDWGVRKTCKRYILYAAAWYRTKDHRHCY